MNVIPIMDDPLGKYWRQPIGLREALMDDTHVLLTDGQINDLMCYNSSLPSGVYPGKVWRRLEVNPSRDLLAWYGPETDDHRCPILFREILKA